MELEEHRCYADVATQTSPFTSPLIAPIYPTSGVISFLAATSQPTPTTPDSNCIANEETLRNDERTPEYALPESPIAMSSQLHLPSFPSSFGLQRCPGSRLTASTQSSNRTVSLPGTLYDEDLCLALSQLIDNDLIKGREQHRVVSMPESAQLHAKRSASSDTFDHHEHYLSAASCDDGDDLRSHSSTPSTPRTIVMHSLSSDHFHTPSPPPSSCDSVEFTLDDAACLPDSFLRRSISPPIFIPEATNKAAGLVEDDGWLTWANSPPRPIPALHGPSSLPYARCPSGAEGTIIGEPSSLPRMIWGLDPNDAVPTAHLSQSQQSRAVPIKHPESNLKLRCGAVQGPVSTNPMPAPLVTPSIGPRFRNTDVEYTSGVSVGSMYVPVAPGSHREEGTQGDIRATMTGSAGLGFNVSKEPIRQSGRYDRSMHRNGIMEYSCSLRMGSSPNTLDGEFEMPSADVENQRLPEVQTREEIYRHPSHRSVSRRGHPSNLIELLSSPVSLLDTAANANPCALFVTPRLSAANFNPNNLPTPPNSSSPQWSSLLSPLRNDSSSNLTGFHHGGGLLPGVRVRHEANTTNEELSEELRRFVFENMSSASPTAVINHAPRAPYANTPNNFSPVHYIPIPSTESPAHPPGLPIPQHILLSKALEPFDPLSAQASSPTDSSASPSSSYARSTLSNPRSIPLSRLRQKRSEVKLATVLEEDSAEPNATYDRGLVAPAHASVRLSVRSPSPSGDKLHAQSIEDKATFGEENKLGPVRVKLPHSSNARAGSALRANTDSGQSTTLMGSPKRKRLQRRKKAGKLVEIAKVGFPLVPEGTVSFGSPAGRKADAHSLEGFKMI